MKRIMVKTLGEIHEETSSICIKSCLVYYEVILMFIKPCSLCNHVIFVSHFDAPAVR